MSAWQRFVDWLLWRELARDPFFGRGYARRVPTHSESTTEEP